MKLDRKWLLLLLGLVIVFIVDFPILTVALNSFRTTETIISSHSILPTEPTLANYVYINTRTHFWTFLFNSLIVAFAASALAIVLASLAGFAMSRFRARILGPYNQSLLVVQMFPLILAIIPLFILFRNLNMVITSSRSSWSTRLPNCRLRPGCSAPISTASRESWTKLRE